MGSRVKKKLLNSTLIEKTALHRGFEEKLQIEDNSAYDSQVVYCGINKLPAFAPSRCTKCKKSLTQLLSEKHGISKAMLLASTTLITFCPGCGYSWCD